MTDCVRLEASIAYTSLPTAPWADWRSLLYGLKSSTVGPTHFCCSAPNARHCRAPGSALSIIVHLGVCREFGEVLRHASANTIEKAGLSWVAQRNLAGGDQCRGLSPCLGRCD